MFAATLLHTALLSAAPTAGFNLPPLDMSFAQPEDEAGEDGDEDEDDEGDGDDPLAEDEAAAPEETADERSAAPPGDPSAAPADDGGKRKNKEWNLQIQPGGEFFVSGDFLAKGATFRFGAWKQLWIGGFMVGGGPYLHYSILVDPAASDTVGLLTFNGDFIIGGGTYQKFAVFFHATAGLGIGHVSDNGGDTLIVPIARPAAGVGGYGHITDRVSIGAMVDFGYYVVAVGVDAMVMLGFHFGK